ILDQWRRSHWLAADAGCVVDGADTPAPDQASRGARPLMIPQVFTRLDATWPSTLDNVDPAATSLYALGDLSCLRAPLCAVVGTRMATDYGTRVTTQLVSALASAGVGIVSGLARGIDATAHR